MEHKNRGQMLVPPLHTHTHTHTHIHTYMYTLQCTQCNIITSVLARSLSFFLSLSLSLPSSLTLQHKNTCPLCICLYMYTLQHKNMFCVCLYIYTLDSHCLYIYTLDSHCNIRTSVVLKTPLGTQITHLSACANSLAQVDIEGIRQ